MQVYRRRSWSLLVFVLLTLLLPNAVKADVTESILGVVRDRTNAVIVGAHVVATNVETNFSKAAISGSDGQYRILALPAGTYKLSAGAPGFQLFTTTDIDVKVNDQLRIDVTLDVGSLQNEVTVAASAVQVETESTQLGDVIESKKMLSLPLNGRSYLDLLGLQAGVVPVTSGVVPNDRSVSGMFASPGNVSVNGQRETSNAFLVNGGDVSEGRNLGAGLIPNLDSVAEFRLITNSFDPEYGKFSGAIIHEHLDGLVSVRYSPHVVGRYQADGSPLAATSQPRPDSGGNEGTHRCGSYCPGHQEAEKAQNGKPKEINGSYVLLRTDHVLNL